MMHPLYDAAGWASVVIIVAAVAFVIVHHVQAKAKRLPVTGRELKTRISLGARRRVPSSLAAQLTFPLLQADNCITENAEFSHATDSTYNASGLYVAESDSPPRHYLSPESAAVASASPFSPRSQLAAAEGLWVEGMSAFVVTEPSYPFAIVSASRDWLQFCGFTGAEVKGRTLRVLQGPATERLLAAKLVEAVKQGKAIDAVLTNYTKHCLPFRNHLHVQPFTDRRGVLGGFKVVTHRAEVLGRSPARPLEMWSARAMDQARDEANIEGDALL